MTIHGLTYRISGTVTFEDGSIGLIEASYNGNSLQYSESTPENIWHLEQGSSTANLRSRLGLSTVHRLTRFTPGLGMDVGPGMDFTASDLYTVKQVSDYVLHVSGAVSNDDGTTDHFDVEARSSFNASLDTNIAHNSGSEAHHNTILADAAYLDLIEQIWGAAYGDSVIITAAV